MQPPSHEFQRNGKSSLLRNWLFPVMGHSWFQCMSHHTSKGHPIYPKTTSFLTIPTLVNQSAVFNIILLTFSPCAGSSTTSSPRRTVPHSSLHEGMTIAIDTFPWRQMSRQASRQKPLWLITWHRHSNHRPFYDLIKFLLGERGHRASEPFNSCSLSWHCKHVCCQRCCLLGLDGISMEPHME